MATNWTDYIPWIYISIQVSISLIVSIMGAIFVKGEFKRQKRKMKQQMEIEINIQQKVTGDLSINARTNNEVKEEEKSKEDAQYTTKKDDLEKFKMLSTIGFGKLYLSTVWKMRSVYGSLAVHAFDVLTDGLVIINWWNYEKDQDVENVDARTMAWCGIAILLFHKFISVIAFWSKEGNIWRCLLQFFDLLIFEEIYTSHKKILIQLSDKNEENDDDAIETTSTFKYVRNLEAIFESIPQSILQLVFIMRTKWEEESEEGSIFLLISILSILQSIISMTNSILKNDNVYMTLPKYKPYKKRVPPSWKFIKHLIARLSEVVYRIGLFALFWSVCEGLAFGVMLAIEVIMLTVLIIWWEKMAEGNDLSLDDICLRVQAIVIIPSEFIYAEEAGGWFAGKFDKDEFKDRDNNCIGFFLGCLPCLCCYTPATILSSGCHLREDDPYIHPGLRIGLSMVEWIFVIIWALAIPERSKFLFSFNYGLAVFIVSGICYFIHTQYMYFFPNFALPGGVSIRSIHGYAFNGELEEIQRLKRPKKFLQSHIVWNDENPAESKLPVDVRRDSVWGMAFYGDLEGLKKKRKTVFSWGHWENRREKRTPILYALSNKQYDVAKYIEENASEKTDYAQGKICADMNMEIARAYIKADYWDKTAEDRYSTGNCRSPAMYALAMGNYHVLEYLEEVKGAKLHRLIFKQQKQFKTMSSEFARKFFDKDTFNKL